MHACKSHEPKLTTLCAILFLALTLKSELKSQVLISDRAHQLESVILTLGRVGHKNAGNVATSFPKAPRRRIAQSRAWLARRRNARKRNKGARRGAHHIHSLPSPATARQPQPSRLRIQILLLDLCVSDLQSTLRKGVERWIDVGNGERIRKMLHEANWPFGRCYGLDTFVLGLRNRGSQECAFPRRLLAWRRESEKAEESRAEMRRKADMLSLGMCWNAAPFLVLSQKTGSGCDVPGGDCLVNTSTYKLAIFLFICNQN
jgi:hypothetical protein